MQAIPELEHSLPQARKIIKRENKETVRSTLRRRTSRAGSQHFVTSARDATFGGGIGVILGSGDMANRLRFVAACFPPIFLMSGLTDAHAADPRFCRQFAEAAISQVRGALADPRCGAGVQGARWSTDFAVHYEWCLGASSDAAGAEGNARTRFLRACTSR
jgi:hypothetical protein